MEQMGYYNDIEFNNKFYVYHPNDNSLKCENNIVYYLGDTKAISGNCGVNHGECINLRYIRIGTLNESVWKLDSHVLYFYIREYINAIYQTNDISSELNNIKDYIKLDITTFTKFENDHHMLSSFMDYYNALRMYENYLADDLNNNYLAIKNWFKTTFFSININDKAREIILSKLQDNLKEEEHQNKNNPNNNGSNGKARARKGPTGVYIPEPSPIPDGFDGSYEKAAFTNLLLIIFIIIITIAIVLTLLFL